MHYSGHQDHHHQIGLSKKMSFENEPKKLSFARCWLLSSPKGKVLLEPRELTL